MRAPRTGALCKGVSLRDDARLQSALLYRVRLRPNGEHMAALPLPRHSSRLARVCAGSWSTISKPRPRTGRNTTRSCAGVSRVTAEHYGFLISSCRQQTPGSLRAKVDTSNRAKRNKGRKRIGQGPPSVHRRRVGEAVASLTSGGRTVERGRRRTAAKLSSST